MIKRNYVNLQVCESELLRPLDRLLPKVDDRWLVIVSVGPSQHLPEGVRHVGQREIYIGASDLVVKERAPGDKTQFPLERQIWVVFAALVRGKGSGSGDQGICYGIFAASPPP